MIIESGKKKLNIHDNTAFNRLYRTRVPAFMSKITKFKQKVNLLSFVNMYSYSYKRDYSIMKKH